MSLVCPISENYIDNNTARLNALFALGIVLAFILTPFKWIIFIGASDFLLRRILNGRFSYISRLSNYTTGVFGLRRNQINAGPKLFAANVGFVLSLFAGLFYYADIHSVAYILAGALAFFTILEGFLNICVACLLYPFVSKYIA